MPLSGRHTFDRRLAGPSRRPVQPASIVRRRRRPAAQLRRSVRLATTGTVPAGLAIAAPTRAIALGRIQPARYRPGCAIRPVHRRPAVVWRAVHDFVREPGACSCSRGRRAPAVRQQSVAAARVPAGSHQLATARCLRRDAYGSRGLAAAAACATRAAPAGAGPVDGVWPGRGVRAHYCKCAGRAAAVAGPLWSVQ